MNPHPHLRAYLAGCAVPTFVLPLFLGMYALGRFAYEIPIPFERVMVFPLALLPILWGAWNVVYFLLGSRLPIGLHGAILILLLGPLAYFLSRVVLDLSFPFPVFLGVVYPAILITYYLVWKYVVSFFNRLLGLA